MICLVIQATPEAPDLLIFRCFERFERSVVMKRFERTQSQRVLWFVKYCGATVAAINDVVGVATLLPLGILGTKGF